MSREDNASLCPSDNHVSCIWYVYVCTYFKTQTCTSGMWMYVCLMFPDFFSFFLISSAHLCHIIWGLMAV